jgi:hypothetical protein
MLSMRGTISDFSFFLLQFDSTDYNMIEEGKNKVSWWGTVEPIAISAPGTIASTTSALADVASYLGGTSTPSPSPLPAPAAVASAEVSISKDIGSSNSAGAGRTTSLQF